jgi:hypothetical protein
LAKAVPTVRATGLALRLAAVAAFAVGGAAQAQAASIEQAVKAAYLAKFAPFVAWPPAAFSSSSSAFQLCILGQDPFGGSLDQAVSNQRIDGRSVTVRRLERVDAASGCHILYLGASRGQTADEAVRAVRGSPTLTVGDNGRARGAIIQFVVKDNRVRFEIDAEAAAANHVTISSKLLSLATSIKTGAS